jgi:hypothetical protein
MAPFPGMKGKPSLGMKLDKSETLGNNREHREDHRSGARGRDILNSVRCFHLTTNSSCSVSIPIIENGLRRQRDDQLSPADDASLCRRSSNPGQDQPLFCPFYLAETIKLTGANPNLIPHSFGYRLAGPDRGRGYSRKLTSFQFDRVPIDIALYAIELVGVDAKKVELHAKLSEATAVCRRQTGSTRYFSAR